MISEGSLSLDISYNRKEYHQETIAQLGEFLLESLQQLIAHCTQQEKLVLTPSDIMVKGMSIAELDQIVEYMEPQGEIENMYTLTPMQKGMWFHSIMDQGSEAYFEQTRFVLKGNLDVEAFSRSLNTLAANHAVLRTNFYQGWRGELLQVVFRHREIGFTYEDLRELDEQQQQAYIASVSTEDKNKGFDLEKDPLMRAYVMRLDNESYQFLWSSHHIQMDGWCMPLIVSEVFEIYSNLIQHGRSKNRTISPYSDYIDWLERQDDEAASQYWSHYLSGYEEQTHLLLEKGRTSSVYAIDQIEFKLDKHITSQISRIAKQYQVTLNTLLQTTWGIILQKYNRTDDVVFGSVVSGRPAEIPGIEQMIGLFINTIPVRITSSSEDRFVDVISRVQEQALESSKFDYYPLYEIQARSTQKQAHSPYHGL